MTNKNQLQEGEFITLYTDASVKPLIEQTKVAWRGKCTFGSTQGSKILTYDKRVARAEMFAILYAAKESLEKFPMLSGLFINSDNLQCVHSFWTFRSVKIHADIADVQKEILRLAGPRWIRVKHVKAHTGGKDIRSYMNKTVDHLTR